MKPLRSRLLLRDLSVGAAFASMAVSGQVPVWALGLVLVAVLVGVSGRRPFARWPRLTAALLVPLAGVLYLAVRRVAGPGAGLLAGTAMALTPVAVLMFRFDNPDALLVLLLGCAAVAAARCPPW